MNNKRTKEQEQVENIFNNLFKTKGPDRSEKEKDEQSILDTGKHQDSLGKDSLPKENIPKQSLPKINLLERGNYTVVDNHVLDHIMKNLNPTQFVVYLYLYRKTYGWNTDTNEISISSSTMQDDLEMSHVTIGKHIAALEKEGLVQIIKEKNRNRSRTYRVLLPSQIDPCLPKKPLGKDDLPKGFNNITERNFRSTPKENLGKDSLGNGYEPLQQQDPSEGDLFSKDSIKDINKNNNNRAEKKLLLLTFSEIINLPEPIIYTLIDKTSCNQIEKWLTFIEDKKEEINNPSGFFRCAIEQEWEVPSKWEDSFKRKKDMEKKAEEEEERIAQEKAQWEEWLETIPEEIYEEAEKYAKRKVEESPINSKSEEIQDNMLEGFKKEFLRLKYEEIR